MSDMIITYNRLENSFFKYQIPRAKLLKIWAGPEGFYFE